jgi:hypothetical protein
VLPEIPMFTTPVYVLHPFGRQLPLRARLFIDFLVESLGVGRNRPTVRTAMRRMNGLRETHGSAILSLATKPSGSDKLRRETERAWKTRK